MLQSRSGIQKKTGHHAGGFLNLCCAQELGQTVHTTLNYHGAGTWNRFINCATSFKIGNSKGRGCPFNDQSGTLPPLINAATVVMGLQQAMCGIVGVPRELTIADIRQQPGLQPGRHTLHDGIEVGFIPTQVLEFGQAGGHRR